MPAGGHEADQAIRANVGLTSLGRLRLRADERSHIEAGFDAQAVGQIKRRVVIPVLDFREVGLRDVDPAGERVQRNAVFSAPVAKRVSGLFHALT